MKHLAVAICLVAVLAGCGGSDPSADGANNPIAAVTSSTETTQATTTSTTSTTTTTTSTTTTTTTVPPPPQELRADYLRSLEDDGWEAYIDEVVGWSIMIPGDWRILTEEPGGMIVFTPAAGGALLVVSPSLDAAAADRGSRDYLAGNIEFGVEEGSLREPGDDDWFWLDTDFDDVEGLFDIAAAELNFAVNLTTGEKLSDDELSPTWWYAYYDPRQRPSYGYIMQTIGVDPVMFEHVDAILLSFEPPSGYPTG